MSKPKLLIFLLVLSTLSVIFLPVFASLYLYPAIDNLLIIDAEKQAQRIANHLTMYFEVPEDILRPDHVSYELKDEILEVSGNFSLEKVSSLPEVLGDAEKIRQQPGDTGSIGICKNF